MCYISVVSPVYKAENTLYELIERLENELSKITENFEIILIDDFSSDNSWQIIENLAVQKGFIKGMKLSRNFGQHYAITCGLDHAKGEWVVVMDCDLQDRPEEIKNLIKKSREGYDVVLASRVYRDDSFFKKISSKIFYRTLSYLTGSKQDETIANFGLYHNKVIKSIICMRESIRYFPTMVKWVGFKQTKIKVKHSSRLKGKSNYNFKKLLNLALNIILAFSDKPIRLTVKFGLIISLSSFAVAGYYFIKWILGEVVVLGYTSLIISIWLLSGIIISTLGIIGLYVGKIFEGVKKRPIYIIEKVTK